MRGGCCLLHQDLDSSFAREGPEGERGEGASWDATSRGLCERVEPSRTNLNQCPLLLLLMIAMMVVICCSFSETNRATLHIPFYQVSEVGPRLENICLCMLKHTCLSVFIRCTVASREIETGK